MHLQKFVQGLKYSDLRKNWKNLREDLKRIYFDEVRDLANHKVLVRFFKLKKELIQKDEIESKDLDRLENILKELKVI